MRILYLHQYLLDPASAAGSSRSYEMARHLAADGHEVFFLTTSARLGESWASMPGWNSHELEGLHLEVLRLPYSNEMPFTERIKTFFQFAMRASLYVRKFKADVVFATSTPLTIAIPGLAAKFWHRIPMIFEVRDLWPEIPIAVGALRNPFTRSLARWLERVAYRASAHVVALSPGMAAGVMKRRIPPSRVSVIPNSCDVNLFDVPAEQGQWVRERLGLEPGQPLIVYTGAFGLINGVGYLVDMAAAMRTIAAEVRFLLVGHGAELDKVKARAERSDVLNRNLWIWPPLPKVRVPDLLAAATVATSVVIPLKELWNNSANKFFDTLAAGKPIVINHEGWQADMIRKSGAGIVLPPDNAVQAAELLYDFISDPERLERAAAAARRLASEEFSLDLMYAKFERVLLNAVARR